MPEIVLALRVALSLGVVLLCLWALARWYERRADGGARGVASRSGAARRSDTAARRSALSVVARAPLSRHTSVALLDVGGRTLVVGVGEQQLTLLADLPSDAAAAEVAPDSLGDGLPSAGLGAGDDEVAGRDPLAARDAVAQILPMLRRGRAALPGGNSDDTPARTGALPGGIAGLLGAAAKPGARTAPASPAVPAVSGPTGDAAATGTPAFADSFAADSFGSSDATASPATPRTAAPSLTDATASPATVPATGHAVPHAGPAADSLGSTVVALRPVDESADSLGDGPGAERSAPVLSRRQRAERERAMRLHPAGKALQVAAGTLPPLDDEAADEESAAPFLPALPEPAPTVADLGAVQRLAAARRPRTNPNGPLAGSVLDPHSWSQAADVLRSLRKAQ